MNNIHDIQTIDEETFKFLWAMGEIKDHVLGITPKENSFIREDQHCIGLIGEYAFAKAFGHEINVNLFRRGDGGIDFRARWHTIDIKATTSRRPILRVKCERAIADLFMLVQVNPERRTSRIVGFAELHEVLKATINGPPRLICDNYEIDATELHDVDDDRVDELWGGANYTTSLREGDVAMIITASDKTLSEAVHNRVPEMPLQEFIKELKPNDITLRRGKVRHDKRRKRSNRFIKARTGDTVSGRSTDTGSGDSGHGQLQHGSPEQQAGVLQGRSHGGGRRDEERPDYEQGHLNLVADGSGQRRRTVGSATR